LSKISTGPDNSYSLAQSYGYCRELARSHYENFPVASRLLPKQTRDAVAVIYSFARQADDFADEGELKPEERISLLDSYSDKLKAVVEDSVSNNDPVFIALADVIAKHDLPLQLFHDLLSAFRQDVTKKRYANFSEVMDYCRRSANPVGRLLLYLHGEASKTNLALSDKVCSALQLINFLQDIQQDYDENNRIYLPQDEMSRFGVNESAIAGRHNTPELHRLIGYQLERVRKMMLDGAILGTRLRGRFGLEIRLIIEAGLTVVEKLSNQHWDVFSRPRLAGTDYLRIGWRALNRHHRLNAREGSA